MQAIFKLFLKFYWGRVLSCYGDSLLYAAVPIVSAMD
jgi:hypothetical protein